MAAELGSSRPLDTVSSLGFTVETQSWGSKLYDHTFSQSWLNSYFTCPEQARHDLLKTYPRCETDASAKGTACHLGVEHMLGGGSLPEAIDLAISEFDDISLHPGFQWVKLKTPDTVYTHIQHSLRVWDRSVYPQLGMSVWVEHPFEILVLEDDERRITLKGTVDYMDDTPELFDWKFTSNEEKFDRYGWEHKRWSVQSTCYSWAAIDAGYYGPDETVPFTFVAITPYREAPIYCETERTIQHIGFLQQQMLKIARFIEQMGVDEPWPLRDQHSLCSPNWCPHWDQCKGRYLTIS